MSDRVRRLGLGAKVTLASASVVMVAVLLIAFGTMLGVRTALLREFEAGAVDQSVVNARLVARTLGAPEVDETVILAALRPPVRSRPLLLDDDRWYSASLQFRSGDIPAGLVESVAAGQPAVQVASTASGTVLVVGIPIVGAGASYFEVFPLAAVESSLETIARTLVIVGSVATATGGLLGHWVSRRVMRPVREVTRTAERIAAGALDARLDPTLDPDLARLALSFNHMADSLSERIAKEERFAADVSHELRSPLTTLSTAISILERRRHELSPQGQEALALLAADAERFQKTVMDLLEINRHDAGVAPTDLVSVPIAEAVRGVTARIDPGVTVEVLPSAIGAVVALDHRRLERILSNLVENAETHGEGLVRLAVSATGGVARVVVEDHGPGVNVADRERIFERFARGDLARQRGTSTGSGLGLALAVENARALGGRVYVDAGFDDGARFVFEVATEGGGW
jgi:signal transduction histidine kinase